MDALFFHPKLVHVPIALAVLMPLIAGGLLVAWWRNWFPARAWSVAVLLQAILCVTGVMALRSGEAEEERVERIVSESLIEAHEEAAEAFVGTSTGVLGVMALAWILSAKRSGLPVAALGTAGTLVVFWLGYRTGAAGGDLVYRHGAGQAYLSSPAAPSTAAESSKREDDDDD